MPMTVETSPFLLQCALGPDPSVVFFERSFYTLKANYVSWPWTILSPDFIFEKADGIIIEAVSFISIFGTFCRVWWELELSVS